MARTLGDEELEAKVRRIPIPKQQVKWRAARAGFPQDVIEKELRKVGVSVRRLEETLSRQEHLLETGFSLADICNFAIAVSLTSNYEAIVNEAATPGLPAWIARMNDRPATEAMYAHCKATMEAGKKSDPALAAR